MQGCPSRTDGRGFCFRLAGRHLPHESDRKFWTQGATVSQGQDRRDGAQLKPEVCLATRLDLGGDLVGLFHHRCSLLGHEHELLHRGCSIAVKVVALELGHVLQSHLQLTWLFGPVLPQDLQDERLLLRWSNRFVCRKGIDVASRLGKSIKHDGASQDNTVQMMELHVLQRLQLNTINLDAGDRTIRPLVWMPLLVAAATAPVRLCCWSEEQASVAVLMDEARNLLDAQAMRHQEVALMVEAERVLAIRLRRVEHQPTPHVRILGVVGQVRNLALLHFVCHKHVVHGPAPSRGSKLLQRGSPL
mmetsp:Transcript_30579/g.72831  ORF Transcript_30579/g.72831 Transcript_30579/m.72831 type:complete len:303 (+) Transcript_30579:267-1175(+)